MKKKRGQSPSKYRNIFLWAWERVAADSGDSFFWSLFFHFETLSMIFSAKIFFLRNVFGRSFGLLRNKIGSIANFRRKFKFQFFFVAWKQPFKNIASNSLHLICRTIREKVYISANQSSKRSWVIFEGWFQVIPSCFHFKYNQHYLKNAKKGK